MFSFFKKTLKINRTTTWTSILPKKATKGSAAIDLKSELETEIQPGETKVISVGFSMILPKGTVGLVCSRSGLAAKNSIAVLNGPGVIDGDFRGQVGVILHNFGKDKFQILIGDRIAQLLVLDYVDFNLKEISDEEFHQNTTDRNTGGFGSTGDKRSFENLLDHTIATEKEKPEVICETSGLNALTTSDLHDINDLIKTIRAWTRILNSDESMKDSIVRTLYHSHTSDFPMHFGDRLDHFDGNESDEVRLLKNISDSMADKMITEYKEKIEKHRQYNIDTLKRKYNVSITNEDLNYGSKTYSPNTGVTNAYTSHPSVSLSKNSQVNANVNITGTGKLSP